VLTQLDISELTLSDHNCLNVFSLSSTKPLNFNPSFPDSRTHISIMTRNDKPIHATPASPLNPQTTLSNITTTLSFEPDLSSSQTANPHPPLPTISSFSIAPSNLTSPTPLQILIIGAGSRGTSYASAALSCSNAVIACICEPIESKRLAFGQRFIWPSTGVPRFGECFSDWREWVEYEKGRRESERTGEGLTGKYGFKGIKIDAVFVCVLDEMHEEVLCGVAGLGVSVCVEKPLSTSLESCGRILGALREAEEERRRKGCCGDAGGEKDEECCGEKKKEDEECCGEKKKEDEACCAEIKRKEPVFGICHVLRYSPHNMMLRHMVLEEEVIGDVLSIEHVEPVGWWHFSHSYVRWVMRDNQSEHRLTSLGVIGGKSPQPHHHFSLNPVTTLIFSCGCFARSRPKQQTQHLTYQHTSPPPARGSSSAAQESQRRQETRRTVSHARMNRTVTTAQRRFTSTNILAKATQTGLSKLSTLISKTRTRLRAKKRQRPNCLRASRRTTHPPHLLLKLKHVLGLAAACGNQTTTCATTNALLSRGKTILYQPTTRDNPSWKTEAPKPHNST
jgi:hypothetical protein